MICQTPVFEDSKVLRTTDTHTGPTMPSGTVSSSILITSGYEDWRAFKHSISGSNSSWASYSNDWIQYEFSAPVTLHSFQYGPPIYSDGTLVSANSPQHFIIEVSNDGINFEVLVDEPSGEVISTNKLTDIAYDISGGLSSTYKFIRMQILSNYGGSFIVISGIKINYYQ